MSGLALITKLSINRVDLSEIKAIVPQDDVDAIRKEFDELRLEGVTMRASHPSGLAPGLAELGFAFAAALGVEALKSAARMVLILLRRKGSKTIPDSRMRAMQDLVEKKTGSAAKCVYKSDGQHSFIYKFESAGGTYTVSMPEKGELAIESEK